MNFFVVAVLAFVVLVVLMKSDRSELMMLTNRYADREPLELSTQLDDLSLSDDERSEAEKFWQKIGNWLRLDPRKMRLTDRFDTHLANDRGEPLSGNVRDMHLFLEDCLRKKGIPQSEFSNISIIGDLLLKITQNP